MSDFEEKVKKAILKTGLPTEIKVTKMLKDAGWSVFNEYPYLDREENKMRTLDITAKKVFLKSKNTEDGSLKIDLACELYLECKKSTKQSWVFYTELFPESFTAFSLSRLSYDIVYGTFNAALRAYLTGIENINGHTEHVTIFSKIPLRFESMKYKIALSQQNVFNEKQEFYEGKMQVLKALLHKDEEEKAKPPKNPFSVKVIPIIVFDGRMCECYYEGGKLSTPEIEYTRYLAHGLPNQRFPALIDVMTLNYFPKYLKFIEKEFNPS
jgi:hypothetical protein